MCTISNRSSHTQRYSENIKKVSRKTAKYKSCNISQKDCITDASVKNLRNFPEQLHFRTPVNNFLNQVFSLHKIVLFFLMYLKRTQTFTRIRHTSLFQWMNIFSDSKTNTKEKDTCNWVLRPNLTNL